MRSLTIASFLIGAPLLLCAADPAPVAEAKPADPYADFTYEKSNNDGKGWVRTIAVKTPACRADVKGKVQVEFTAPGLTVAKATCWQQPNAKNPAPFGHDVDVVTDLKLDADGHGTFEFPADDFPNGPTILRIYAHDAATKKRDLFELQLYNQGGAVWKQGIPKTDPPAAKGMKLVFADDFDKDLSISKDGQGATYCSHKPPNGDFSAWPFSDFEGDMNPFSRVGTFLKIHAAKRSDGKTSSGLISSARMDGTGIFATAPYYFECRFVAHSAPGTWPAFWLLNQGTIKKGMKCDELDVIEAYGGLGAQTPNNDHYTLCTHFWGQNGPDGKPLMGGAQAKDVRTQDLPGKAYWTSTFHIYGVQVTATDTIYYCDDTEVFRHPSGTISSTDAYFFLINLAVGGAWPADLARYGDATDMFVDYVRVYQGEQSPPKK